MKLKTIIMWCVIGAVANLCVSLMYFLLNLNIISYSLIISIIGGLVSMAFNGGIALFFYTLFKNQK